MTTPAAARLYQAQHERAMEGRGLAVFNPNDRPLDELPVIYGFINGGRGDWLNATALAADGAVLGGHVCSAEGYAPHDLGLLEGTRQDRHEKSYQPHYPNGYRMEFVLHADAAEHVGLMAAVAANQKESES